MFTQSVFSKVTKKGKRRSSGIAGFTIRSLLNGKRWRHFAVQRPYSGVLTEFMWRNIYPTRLCQYLMKSPPIFKVLKRVEICI